MTADAKRALELAIRAAHRGHDREISSGHLLLGILDQGNNRALTLLTSADVQPAALRAELTRRIGSLIPPTDSGPVKINFKLMDRPLRPSRRGRECGHRLRPPASRAARAAPARPGPRRTAPPAPRPPATPPINCAVAGIDPARYGWCRKSSVDIQQPGGLPAQGRDQQRRPGRIPGRVGMRNRGRRGTCRATSVERGIRGTHSTGFITGNGARLQAPD